MIIKKRLYECTCCKYKTTKKLTKLIHEQIPGHKMKYVGCQKRTAKNKFIQRFEM